MKSQTENKPWWLRKENLLGNVELDYGEQKEDTKPLTPGKEVVAEKLLEAKEEQIDDRNSGVKSASKSDSKMNDERKTLTLRPAQIPMKEIKQAVPGSQDQATGGATLNEHSTHLRATNRTVHYTAGESTRR